MSSTGARVAEVRTAERKGAGNVTEDRVFVTPNSVMVLDGASQPTPSKLDGGWLAEVVGSRMAQELTEAPNSDLSTLLAAIIHDVAMEFQLSPGSAPSSTISILRWNAKKVDLFVLGDSPIVVLAANQQVHCIHDDRLSRVAEKERAALNCGERRTFMGEQPDKWKALVEAQRLSRNKPNGYWIVEAVPEAAYNAVSAEFLTPDLLVAIVMTDGVAKGVERYGIPTDWRSAIRLAIESPEKLVEVVHQTEEGDPDGRRWPRSKRHDDKAIAVVSFDPSHRQ